MQIWSIVNEQKPFRHDGALTALALLCEKLATPKMDFIEFASAVKTSDLGVFVEERVKRISMR